MLFVGAYLVLQNVSTQQKVLAEVTSQLSEKVHSKVSAGDVMWSFPNVFVFNDLYVEDQQQDTLLYVRRARVTVNILPLFNHQVSLRTVQLNQMRANVYMIDSTRYNFQFLIDAFKKKDTTKVKWTADFETVGFKDCSVSFHRDSVNTKPGRFNPAYLDITNLNGHIFIRSLKPDSIDIRLRKLCFEEASGVVLRNLTTAVLSNKHELRLQNFSTSMPNSTIAFERARLRYADLKSKNFTHDFHIDLKLKPSQVQLGDLKAFVPALGKLNETVNLRGEIVGTVDNFDTKNFYVSYGEDIVIDGDVHASGLPQLNNVKATADIRQISVRADDIREIAGAFLNREIYLPAQLDSMGLVSFKGNLDGSTSNFKADGVLSSAPGDISVNVQINSKARHFAMYSIKGDVETHGYRLGDVLGQKSQVGNTTFKLGVDLERTDSLKRKFSIKVNGKVDTFTYKQYPYQNIVINGGFNQRGFDGILNIDDPNANLKFKGNVNLNKAIPEFHFDATVGTLNLGEVHLAQNLEDHPSLTFSISTDFVGKNFDDLDGSFSIDNVTYHKAAGKDLLLNNVSLSVQNGSGKRKTAKLYSDYINGTIDGEYKLSSLVANIKKMLHTYVPSVIPLAKNMPDGNNFTFNFDLANTESLSEVFPIPVSVVNDANISGFFNDANSRFRVRFTSPLMHLGKMNVEDVSVLCENPKDEAKLMVRLTNLPQNKRRNPYYFSLNATAKNDSIQSRLNFSNSAEVTYSGELNVLSVLRSLSKRGLTADFYVRPTEFVIDDVTWNMHESQVHLTPDTLSVNNFLLDHEEQMLKIDGMSSKVSSDSLGIFLKGFELNYISNIVNHPRISFAGRADGEIYAHNLLSKPYFKANLSVDSTALNSQLLGDLDVAASFDIRDKAIDFGATLDSYLSHAKSDIVGGVYLAQDSMDISGDLRDVDLKFLRKYFGAVLEDFTAVANGHVRAYGKFGDFGLEGRPYISDASFGIGLLNTDYYFSDTVYMTHESFCLRNVKAHDKFGNTAITNGCVTHRGFKGFEYQILMNCKNMLALNTTEQDNDMYYGTAFGDGLVKIEGNTSVVKFDLNVTPCKNTKITIPIGGSASVDKSDFISFVENTDRLTASEKRRNRREKIKKIQEEKVLTTRVILNMNLDVNPDAQIYIIMDPRQGDLIRANGKGMLHLSYDSQTAEFGMLGTYELTKGDYSFSVQSIITRKFDILEGSLLHWSGSPYSADLDVTAKYSLNASLVNILDDPTSNLNMANVDCMLYLTGTMQKPIIKFGIELPNADDEVKRKLASVLNTEEELNKNVASLLALGYFYTLDKKSSQNSSSTNGLSSVGFSTISSEIASVLSSLDNNVDVGLNYNPGSDVDATASEFEVNLSTQLMNDRLQLSGNFGYRDNIPSGADNVSSGIMDFDVEYKLTPSGKFRLKGFNRSNNSYFKQSASQTQGVGFVYREDFDSYSEWLNVYMRSLRNMFTRKSASPKEKVNEDTVKVGGKK